MAPATEPNPEASCAFCGLTSQNVRAIAECSVCGMKIDVPHYPHIIHVDPDQASAHFCSVSCMENYDFLEDEPDG